VEVLGALLFEIRSGRGEGYVQVVEGHFVHPPSGVAPGVVSQTVADDSEQPGQKRPAGVVGGAYAMDGKEDVLHQVLYDLEPGEPAPLPDDQPDPRRNRAQQFPVGIRVAGLRCSHQGSEIVGGCGIWHIRGSVAPSKPSLRHEATRRRRA
jgi:hypothetical protein